jgi:hypothetical protein
MKSSALLLAAFSLLLPLAVGGADTNEIARGAEAAPRYVFSDYVVSFFWNYAPVVLMVGFLIWGARRLGIMAYYRRLGEHLQRAEDHMQRQEVLLERIAKSLEKRDGDPP